MKKLTTFLSLSVFLILPLSVFAQSAPSSETIQILINDFSSPIKDRLTIKQALVNIGEPAVDLLVINLNNQSYIIRSNVADVLGSIKSFRAIGPLINTMLGDAELIVRKEADYALFRIGEPVIEPLLSELIKNSSQRPTTARLLRELNDELVKPRIESKLVSESVFANRQYLESLLLDLNKRIALKKGVKDAYGVEIKGGFDEYELNRISLVLRSIPNGLINGLKVITDRHPESVISAYYGTRWEVIFKQQLAGGTYHEDIDQLTLGLYAGLPDIFHELMHAVDDLRYGMVGKAFADLHNRSGFDSDNYPVGSGYFGNAASYASSNSKEDFAVTAQFYLADLKNEFSAAIQRAKLGKTIYLEKLLFMMDVFSNNYISGRPAGLATRVYKLTGGGNGILSRDLKISRSTNGKLDSIEDVNIYNLNGSYNLVGLEQFFSSLTVQSVVTPITSPVPVSTATTTPVTIISTTTPAVTTPTIPTTFAPPQFVIVSPTVSELVEVGKPYNIRWQMNAGNSTKVRLSLYKSGGYLRSLVIDILNSGNYQWQVPLNLVPTSDYFIRIFDISYPNNYYDSARFALVAPSSAPTVVSVVTPTVTAVATTPTTIATTTTATSAPAPMITTTTSVSSAVTQTKPTFAVVAPIAGEQVQSGRQYVVKWTYSGPAGVSTVRLSLYKKGGFRDFITTDTANDGQYEWNVSDYLAGGSDYQVRIFSPFYSNDYFDSGKFAIVSPTAAAQTSQPTAVAQPTTTTTQTTTASSPSTTSTTPASTTSTSPATSSSTSTATTTSSSSSSTTSATQTTTTTTTQTSVAPRFTISAPGAGVSLTAGSNYTITWQMTQGNSTSIRLSLYQNGSFKDFIVADTANDGSHTWVVSNTAGSGYSIRIFDLAYPNDYADSGQFSIIASSASADYAALASIVNLAQALVNQLAEEIKNLRR